MPGVTALKRDGCNVHSDSLLDRRDSLSASVFSLPGMCTTVSQTLRDMHHSQICLAKRLFYLEWHVPIWFIVVTAVVLSAISSICLPEIVPSNDFSARKAASICCHHDLGVPMVDKVKC